MLSAVAKSLSLKSYLTFHPRFLNFLRSMIILWNQVRQKINLLYLGFSEGYLITLNLSSAMLVYNLNIFDLSDLGGSVVTLKDFWRIVIGNYGWGSVDNHNLKFSWTLALSISNYSMIFSNSLRNDSDKWQFAKYNQWPILVPLNIRLCITFIDLFFSFFSLSLP